MIQMDGSTWPEASQQAARNMLQQCSAGPRQVSSSNEQDILEDLLSYGVPGLLPAASLVLSSCQGHSQLCVYVQPPETLSSVQEPKAQDWIDALSCYSTVDDQTEQVGGPLAERPLAFAALVISSKSGF